MSRAGEPLCEHKDRPIQRRGLCNACYSRQRYWANPEHYRRLAIASYHRRGKPVRDAAYYLRTRYGMTPEGLDALIASQDGKCAICGTPIERGKGFKAGHIDHDHATGTVRGILCGQCNNGLGNFRDDLALVRAAADYLERPH